MPLHEWEAVDKVSRARMKAHLRLRTVVHNFHEWARSQESGKDTPGKPKGPDVTHDMLASWGGVRKR